jgi:hypothetical protein
VLNRAVFMWEATLARLSGDRAAKSPICSKALLSSGVVLVIDASAGATESMSVRVGNGISRPARWAAYQTRVRTSLSTLECVT